MAVERNHLGDWWNKKKKWLRKARKFLLYKYFMIKITTAKYTESEGSENHDGMVQYQEISLIGKNYYQLVRSENLVKNKGSNYLS